MYFYSHKPLSPVSFLQTQLRFSILTFKSSLYFHFNMGIILLHRLPPRSAATWCHVQPFIHLLHDLRPAMWFSSNVFVFAQLCHFQSLICHMCSSRTATWHRRSTTSISTAAVTSSRPRRRTPATRGKWVCHRHQRRFRFRAAQFSSTCGDWVLRTKKDKCCFISHSNYYLNYYLFIFTV